MEDAIIEIHGRFVRDTIDAMAYDTNKLTIIPSLVFLVSNFYIIYKFCHRFTRIGVTTLKKWTIREATFHSSFFYISKLWLVFIKLYKLCSTVICVKIANKSDLTFCYDRCKVLGFVFISLLSLTPICVYTTKSIIRRGIPNFLLWVAQDPWANTEIGLAGHYLDRPPLQFIAPRRAQHAYNIHRSTSDHILSGRGKLILRVSKSLENPTRMERLVALN